MVCNLQVNIADNDTGSSKSCISPEEGRIVPSGWMYETGRKVKMYL